MAPDYLPAGVGTVPFQLHPAIFQPAAPRWTAKVMVAGSRIGRPFAAKV